MIVRLYGVLLACLASVSLAIFPIIENNTDKLSFSIAKRLLFALARNSVFSWLRLIAVGDILHIYTAALHIGEKKLLDVGNWNDMTFGNIGITTVLFVSRVAWFLIVGLRRFDDGKKEA